MGISSQTFGWLVRGAAAIALLAGSAGPALARGEDGRLAAKVKRFENGLRPALRRADEPAQRWTLAERMAHYHVPGVSIAIIENGRIVFAKGYGVKGRGRAGAVDADTVFSVGSLSKVGTATLVLALANDKRLDLNSDINLYLSRWKVPATPLTAGHPVTLRGLMSHSGGLSVSGFPDFEPDAKVPTLEDSLAGRFPAVTGPVLPFYVPGSRWYYSGGGTSVIQMAIEDVTGRPFADVARERLFEPLGMSRSTYQSPLPETYGNIALAHDRAGALTALPRGWQSFPETAASGLWTTPSDYARMLVALMESYRRTGAYLPSPIAKDMMTEVGVSRFGLGPMMSGAGDTRRFMHSGSNDSYKAWMEGHLATGNGLVIFTNAPMGRELYVELRRAVSDAFDWPFYKEVVVSPSLVPASTLDDYAGDYAIVDRTFSPANRALGGLLDRETLTVERRPEGVALLGLPLQPSTPTIFHCEGYDCDLDGGLTLEFILDADGHPAEILLHDGRSTLVARKRHAG
ncbi:serine hydrolase domain-containing protein [Sphingopyxis kveilinensis]|uniref:serine hydrolase domain-containing protein n=1 Tax=Sphingopyxis kveilinensis TaxID=3114367 RepID=UPI0030CDD52D